MVGNKRKKRIGGGLCVVAVLCLLYIGKSSDPETTLTFVGDENPVVLSENVEIAPSTKRKEDPVAGRDTTLDANTTSEKIDSVQARVKGLELRKDQQEASLRDLQNRLDALQRNGIAEWEEEALMGKIVSALERLEQTESELVDIYIAQVEKDSSL